MQLITHGAGQGKYDTEAGHGALDKPSLLREEDRRNPEIQCYLKLLQQILDTL